MALYEPTIGLEIHVELKTKTKMFCYSLNDPNEKHPNVNICPICMGHPGTLPTINGEAVKKVVMVGLALHGDIAEFSQFDRKNYFYPDLPKGYQISQYEYPLVKNGFLEIPEYEKNRTKRFRIRRIHLEEDTGKLVHEGGSSTSSGRSASLIDFNRAGVPLMELVTEPDFRGGEEVKAFGEELQKILRYLEVSDADMEKGQMRVEVNISLTQPPASSLQPPAFSTLGTKVEVKNINSFKFAQDAVEYEIKRQSAILDQGEKIVQETRGWDEEKKETVSQRGKEEAHDYRYFPEPDLPPLRISQEMIEEIQAQIPELPLAKRVRFWYECNLSWDTIVILTRDKHFSEYFEEVMSELVRHDRDTKDEPKRRLAKTAALFLTGDFLRMLGETGASVRDTRVTPENFAELVLFFSEDKISHTAAKEVLEEMFRSGNDPSDIIEERGLWQMSNVKDLEDVAAHIIRENPKAAEDYKSGKSASAQFLVGQVMKETRGKANPKIVQEIVQKFLS